MISQFNFGEHLLDIGGRKRVLRRFANGFEFNLRLAQRLTRSGGTERTPHPFSNGDLLALGHSADLFHLGIRKKDLKPLTHTMSIS